MEQVLPGGGPGPEGVGVYIVLTVLSMGHTQPGAVPGVHPSGKEVLTGADGFVEAPALSGVRVVVLDLAGFNRHRDIINELFHE